LLYSDSRYR